MRKRRHWPTFLTIYKLKSEKKGKVRGFSKLEAGVIPLEAGVISSQQPRRLEARLGASSYAGRRAPG
jgi:hypothetical protein